MEDKIEPKSFNRFEVIFESMQTSIANQTAILQSLLNVQLEEKKARIRKEELEKVDNSVVPEKTKEKEIDRRIEQESSKFFGFLSGINLPTWLSAGALASIFTFSNVFRAGGLILLAPIIGDVIGNSISNALMNMTADDLDTSADSKMKEEFAKALGSKLSTAGFYGAIGLIFSRKIALIFAAAGFASTYGDVLLEAAGFSENEMIDVFGRQLAAQDVSTAIAAALGGALALGLLRPVIWKGVASLAIAGLTSAAFIPLLAGGAVAGLLMFGDQIKSWLETQATEMGLQDADTIASMSVDGLTGALAGATIGKFFGPGGLIVGAAVGLVLSLGSKLVSYLRDADKKIRDSAIGEAAAITKSFSENVDKTLSETDLNHINKAISESKRALEGNIASNDEIQMLEENITNLTAILTENSRRMKASGADIAPIDSRRIMQGTIEDIINSPNISSLLSDQKTALQGIELLTAELAKSTAIQERATELGMSLEEYLELSDKDSALRRALTLIGLEDILIRYADEYRESLQKKFEEQNLVSKTEKQSFLTTLGKSLGLISAEQESPTIDTPIVANMQEIRLSKTLDTLSAKLATASTGAGSNSVIVYNPVNYAPVNSSVVGGTNQNITNLLGSRDDGDVDYGLPRMAY